MAKQQGLTTYILELINGDQRKITVPSSWKVTFGVAVPYAAGKGSIASGERGYSIRFYENKTTQRAIFTDVRSFRDSSIQIEERVTKTKAQTLHKRTNSGMRDVIVEASVTEWINPDAPQEPTEEFLRIGQSGSVDF